MEYFVEKMTFWSFLAMLMPHFFYTKMAVIPCKTGSYISTIIADMKLRASYNAYFRRQPGPAIIADMKLRASYNNCIGL